MNACPDSLVSEVGGEGDVKELICLHTSWQDGPAKCTKGSANICSKGGGAGS